MPSWLSRSEASRTKLEIFETTGVMDAMKFIQEPDIDQYSAFMAVGGDRTCLEVLNGMMMRKDKKKLSISFINSHFPRTKSNYTDAGMTQMAAYNKSNASM
jgi:hypothetical protein